MELELYTLAFRNDLWPETNLVVQEMCVVVLMRTNITCISV